MGLYDRGDTVNLYFLTYNNYYNRKVKYKTNLQDYLKHKVGELIDCKLFNTNDGVSTSQTYSKSDLSAIPDYLVVCDEMDNIISRWFVTEAVHNRKGQYIFSLRRDLVVDYMSNILDADVFIEKGPLTLNDPMLYNSENIGFNQIKKKQISIKDYTGIPWIVGYIAKSQKIVGPKNNQGNDTAVTVSNNYDKTYNIIVQDLENWEYYNYISSGYKGVLSYIYIVRTRYSLPDNAHYMYLHFGSYVDLSTATKEGGFEFNPYLQVVMKKTTPVLTSLNLHNDLIKKFPNYLETLNNSADPIYNTNNTTLQEIRSLEGKTLYESNTKKAYVIKIIHGAVVNDPEVDVTTNGLYTTMYNMISSLDGYTVPGDSSSSGSTSDSWLAVSVQKCDYYIHLEETARTNIEEYSYIIPDNRIKTQKVPYDIFAIPYGEMKFVYTALSNNVKQSSLDAANLVISDIAKQPDSIIYDLQLLPYCPIALNKDGNGHVVLPSDPYTNPDTQFTDIKDGSGNQVSFILYTAQDSLSQMVTLGDDSIIAEEDPIAMKIRSQTEYTRFCSPNYNGIFEFNPQKNLGLSDIYIYCTFKPFNPYIQIMPGFDELGLYGGMFKDVRGLICGGNFSLTRATDQWIAYELNNKNYQNMFNREIESLDFNNAIQNRHAIVNAITGTMSNTVSGGIMGNTIGGPVGGAVGASVMGAGSVITGVADVLEGAAIRAEARDLKFDMFGYQLGNIKALPASLTRVDSFNIQNNIFPYIEVYDCTDAEKEAFRKKIKYNGMTVMRIGRYGDFVETVNTNENCYIKGSLIRCDIQDDTHTFNALADELNTGFYWEV